MTDCWTGVDDVGKPSMSDYSPIRIYKSNFDKVVEFHRAFNIKVGDEPKMPDRSTNRLRMNLVFEELIELIEAKASGDLGHTTKEIADLIYVLYGYAATIGVDMDAAFEMVHQANMTKLDEMGKPVIRDDGKVVKGPRYKPVKHEDLLVKITR
jgi:predicted HAD superfamily Cof-like phosphohydrolase